MMIMKMHGFKKLSSHILVSLGSSDEDLS